MLTLLPGGRFPFFLYVVLGHEIERVRAGLHLLPLEGAGLVDPEGDFVHQNEAVGADLVHVAGVGMADGAGLMHTAGMIVDGAMGGAGPGHAAGMVVDGAAAGGAGLMHAPDLIVDNAAGLSVGFADADGFIVEGAAADAGLVGAAGVHDPQDGVAGGTGTVDAAMQHHIDRVSEIIESEDEGEAVAVGPMNLDSLSVDQPPQ